MSNNNIRNRMQSSLESINTDSAEILHNHSPSNYNSRDGDYNANENTNIEISTAAGEVTGSS